jgi:prepilin-type N-terminal cleavage/methylation domain-containing protein
MILSSSKVSQRKTQAGMTLPEVMMAVLIGSIVVGAIMILFMFSGRSFAALGNYVDLDSKSRDALDKMVTEIRQAKVLAAYATNSLTFTNFSDQQLTYTWDPSAKTLTRAINGTPDATPLLTQCGQINFKIYQRNPISGIYEFFVQTNNVSVCKLVEISWVCSRKILGNAVNSESVQTAKIVIRNQKVTN